MCQHPHMTGKQHCYKEHWTLYIIYIFNPRDTEVIICIILVLLQRGLGLQVLIAQIVVYPITIRSRPRRPPVTKIRRSSPSLAYQRVHKVIRRHNKETMVTFELRYNCQYYLSSSVLSIFDFPFLCSPTFISPYIYWAFYYV